LEFVVEELNGGITAEVLPGGDFGRFHVGCL